MGSIVTTSNSRPLYQTKQPDFNAKFGTLEYYGLSYYPLKKPDFNAKCGSPEYYGLTQEEYDSWYKRVSDIANGKSVPKYRSPIIFMKNKDGTLSK